MKKSILLAAFLISTTSFLNAQKIGHINSDSLVRVLPETKLIQEEAQKYAKALEEQITSMDTELKTKYEAYMKDAQTMSDVLKQTKEKELQELNKRIEEFKSAAQQDYQKKYSEMTKPVFDKVRKAIEAVAKEGGYKYVLEAAAGGVLYADPLDNLYLAVKKKLDSMPVVSPTSKANTSPVMPNPKK